jgi:hypothetical protein
MLLVSRFTPSESETLLNRFYSILNTPIGQEARLEAVGIRLPAMRRGAEANGKEDLDEQALSELYQSYTAYKLFGPRSSIEILKEPGLDWYYRGTVLVLLGCLLLLGFTWLGAQIMVYLSP